MDKDDETKRRRDETRREERGVKETRKPNPIELIQRAKTQNGGNETRGQGDKENSKTNPSTHPKGENPNAPVSFPSVNKILYLGYQ